MFRCKFVVKTAVLTLCNHLSGTCSLEPHELKSGQRSQLVVVLELTEISMLDNLCY